jgi:transposase
VAAFASEARRLKTAITHHLRDRVLPDRDNQRLLDEIGWHHDRGNLLRFLEEPLVEPTNNRVERALRPAVMARKVSQCSKNYAGAYALSAFKSVIQTLVKRGTRSVLDAWCTLFGCPDAQLAPG